MSINVVSYPDRIINGNNATVSKWNSVHHPIKFGMKREDFRATITVSNSGKEYRVQILASSLNVDQFAEVGESVYLETANGNGVFVIKSITPSSPFFFVDPLPSINVTGSAFVNLESRKNYFVLTNIYAVDVHDDYILIGTSTNKPAINGALDVDISSFLKSMVGYENEFKYLLINEDDVNLGGRYNITVSENWTDYEGSFSVLSETLLRYFTNSVKQIGDLYGSNMGVYVPFDNYDPADERAKFLSDFESPTYFDGYPFSLSFISSDGLALDIIKRVEQEKDINGNNSVSGTITQIRKKHGLSVNRLMLMGGYNAITKTVNVSLQSDVGLVFEAGVTGLFETGLFVTESGLPVIGKKSVEIIEEPVIITSTYTEAFAESFS